MKGSALFLGLLLCCTPVWGADPALRDRPGPAPAGRSETLLQTTGQGSFRVELSLSGGKLAVGPNSLDLTLRDQAGLALQGAEVAVTPWMPSMGHGVWDQPVVTERGGGTYHVENVKIIMAGRWELRVSVRKAAREEQAIFPFEVTERGGGSQKGTEQQGKGYETSQASYTVPNVTLLNQDGEMVRLRSLTDSGKPVVLTFIFTSCTSVCPLLSAALSRLRSELGEQASRVQIVSITIDPEHDRPEVMKEYGARFDAGPGWSFLTGTRDDIGRVLMAFDAFIVDKMSHEPLYFLRGPNSEQWVRIRGVIGMGDLMGEFRRIEHK